MIVSVTGDLVGLTFKTTTKGMLLGFYRNRPNFDNHQIIDNMVLDVNDSHEDTVYNCEFSSADPFRYASLSYNGRFFLCGVNDDVRYTLILNS